MSEPLTKDKVKTTFDIVKEVKDFEDSPVLGAAIFLQPNLKRIQYLKGEWFSLNDVLSAVRLLREKLPEIFFKDESPHPVNCGGEWCKAHKRMLKLINEVFGKCEK